MRNTVSCFNIYIVVFAFLSGTIEEGKIQNFNILPGIHSDYNMILYLFQTGVLFFQLKKFPLPPF